MAYVAISDSLCNEVRNQIDRMERAERKSVGEFNYVLPGSMSAMLEKAWGEHLHFKETIPKEWCGTQDTCTVRVPLVLEGTDTTNVDLDYRLDPPLVVPPKYSRYGFIVRMSADTPELQGGIEHYRKCWEVEQRWNKVNEQVLNFLRKCKSLNEAVKLWPQIEMYVPHVRMEKLREKKEVSRGASAGAEALKALDVDHLTASAVIARMSGATS